MIELQVRYKMKYLNFTVSESEKKWKILSPIYSARVYLWNMMNTFRGRCMGPDPEVIKITFLFFKPLMKPKYLQKKIHFS